MKDYEKKTKDKIALILTIIFFSSLVPCFNANVYGAETTENNKAIEYGYLDYGDFTYMNRTDNTVYIVDYKGDSSTVIIPSEINGLRVTNINSAGFLYKNDIVKSITLPDDFDIESTEDFLDYMPNLEEIKVNDTNKYYSSQDGVLYSKDKTVLYKYPNGKDGDSFKVPDTVTEVKESFTNSKLKKIYVPTTVSEHFCYNDKIQIIRDFKIDDFKIESESFKINKPVEISCRISNIGNVDTDHICISFVVEDDEGNKTELPDVWLNDKDLVSEEWIPEKTCNYKISAKVCDSLGETEEITQNNILIVDNKFEYNYLVSPKNSANLGEEITLNASVSEDAQYSFLAEKNETTKVIRDYSKDNSFIWTPEEEGTYNLYVDIKLQDGTVIRRELCNHYEVSGKYENKLKDIRNGIYRCMLNNTTFYMDDYLKTDEYDDFIKDASINTYIPIKNGYMTSFSEDTADENYKKLYKIVDSIMSNITWDKCLYNVPISINVAIDRNSQYVFMIGNCFGYSNNEDRVSDIIEDFKNNYIKDSYTDLEKEVAAVKYLINNCTYDYNALYNGSGINYMMSHSEAGAFINNKAVCQGYAEACEHLLNSIGIECHTISSQKLNHEWNIVKIDGKYYQLDVTWMDSDYSNEWFNFSNSDTQHYSDDIDNKELYEKCTNDFNNINVFGYSTLLNKIIGKGSTNFYTEDVFGNNYSVLSLLNQNVLASIIDNEYIYYIIGNCEDYFMENYDSYTLYTYNILTDENLKVKDVLDYREFNLNGNYIYIFGDEPIKIKDNKVYPKKYTVTFKNENEIEEIQRVNEGEKPKVPESIPVKKGYTFVKWQDSINESVTSDKTIDAVFSPNKYTVTFKNYDGTELESREVTAGSDISIMEADLKRPGYVFAGWKIEGQEVNYYDDIFKDTISNIVSDMTLEAYYVPLFYYNVNEDGSISLFSFNSDFELDSDTVYIPEMYDGHAVSNISILMIPDIIKEITISDKISNLKTLEIYQASELQKLFVSSNTTIENGNIYNAPQLEMQVYANSSALEYAKKNNISYNIVDKENITEDNEDNNYTLDDNQNVPGDNNIPNDNQNVPGDNNIPNDNQNVPGDNNTSDDTIPNENITDNDISDNTKPDNNNSNDEGNNGQDSTNTPEVNEEDKNAESNNNQDGTFKPSGDNTNVFIFILLVVLFGGTLKKQKKFYSDL